MCQNDIFYERADENALRLYSDLENPQYNTAISAMGSIGCYSITIMNFCLLFNFKLINIIIEVRHGQKNQLDNKGQALKIHSNIFSN